MIKKPTGSDDFKYKGNSLAHPFLQLAIVYVLCVILLGLAYLASVLLNIPIEHLTADPAMISGAHPFLGFISNIGVLLWAAAASVCLFTYLVLRYRYSSKKALFLLWSGVISTILCLDDLFMLHETVFPWHFRIPEYMIYAGYILAVGGYVVFYAKRILQSEYLLFAGALLLLGLSMTGDQLLPQEGIAYFIEDTLKLFGIGTWFLYFSRYSFQQFAELER